MFTDIELYKVDCQKFYDELKELNESGDPEIEQKTKDLNSKFRDKIRKYLPTCLNIINTNFNCKYSLYKVGKDYNAAFKVIETNVKKTKEEVENELQAFKNSIDFNALDGNVKSQIDLAIEILVTYVDDGSQPKFSNSYLQATEPVASSIITNIPRMSTEALEAESRNNNSIQYNPYANDPIDFSQDDSNFISGNDKPLIDSNSFSFDVNQPINTGFVQQSRFGFNMMDNNSSVGEQSLTSQNVASIDMGGLMQPEPQNNSLDSAQGFTPNTIRTDSEYANSDLIDVNSLSIFGGKPNNQ